MAAMKFLVEAESRDLEVYMSVLLEQQNLSDLNLLVGDTLRVGFETRSVEK